jgi:hypothetical protein
LGSSAVMTQGMQCSLPCPDSGKAKRFDGIGQQCTVASGSPWGA